MLPNLPFKGSCTFTSGPQFEMPESCYLSMAEYNTSHSGSSGQVCVCSVDLSGPASAQTLGTGSLVVSWLPVSQRVGARNDGAHLYSLHLGERSRGLLQARGVYTLRPAHSDTVSNTQKRFCVMVWWVKSTCQANHNQVQSLDPIKEGKK